MINPKIIFVQQLQHLLDLVSLDDKFVIFVLYLHNKLYFFIPQLLVKMVYMHMVTIKDNIYKIRNHKCLIIVYNNPTSLRQGQSVAVATTNFALANKLKI